MKLLSVVWIEGHCVYNFKEKMDEGPIFFLFLFYIKNFNPWSFVANSFAPFLPFLLFFLPVLPVASLHYLNLNFSTFFGVFQSSL